MVQSGNNPLPEPMLTKFYIPHIASLGANKWTPVAPVTNMDYL